MTSFVQSIVMSAPEVRVGALDLPQGASTLVQVACPRASSTAVAFVCDLSDSCPSMKNEFEAMKRLVGELPRTWPVWFYSLSSAQELDVGGSHTVGDLQDGSYAPVDILRDRERLDIGRKRGSFLRPPLEAILVRAKNDGLAAMFVVVLTDGELTDAAQVQVPAECRVVGIMPKQGDGQRRHWSRVLPGSPLLSLEDRRLDEVTQSTSNPFHGRCQLKWSFSDGRAVAVKTYQREDDLWREVTESSMECNLAAESAFLLFDLQFAQASALRLSCTSARTGKRATLPVGPDNALIDPHTLQSLSESLRRASQPLGEVLVDISFGAQGFQDVWQQYVQAHDLAVRREPWVDASGKLVAFASTLSGASVQRLPGPGAYQAVICIASHAPALTCPPGCRIVLIGLNRAGRPALRWKQHQALPVGAPLMDVEMSYHRMEGRWMLRLDGRDPRELEPNGSQKIEDCILADADRPCSVLFSGDLVQP